MYEYTKSRIHSRLSYHDSTRRINTSSRVSNLVVVYELVCMKINNVMHKIRARTRVVVKLLGKGVCT